MKILQYTANILTGGPQVKEACSSSFFKSKEKGYIINGLLAHSPNMAKGPYSLQTVCCFHYYPLRQ